MRAARAFPRFAELLDRRLALEVHTTEDAVRYTYFAALLESGLAPEAVVLELPLPEKGHKKLDLFVEEPPGAGLEFKYDREIPSDKNVNKTQRAAAVFKDLQLLARFRERTGARTFFVYLTGRDMAVYFQNQYPALWNLPGGEALAIEADYIAGQGVSFRKTPGDPWCSLRLTTQGDWTLPRAHGLRVREVETA